MGVNVKLFLRIIGIVFFVTHSGVMYAMLIRPAQKGYQTMARYRLANQMSALQKRTLYTPEKLKGLYTGLSEELQPISPVFGAAKSASGVLQKIYAVESDNPAPALKLVKALFYQHGEQFKPTENKSNAAYALNPGILGLVIGAAEKNKLQDPEVRKYIINEWRAEYKRITDEKKPFSETKINNLLTIINDEYKQDINSARSILLSFLCEKADLTSDHDMIHYLSGVNQFLPIFAKEDKGSEKLRTLFTQQSYIPKDYAVLRSQLKSVGENQAANVAETEDFELAVATILDQKRNVSIYPPQVVRSSYGYQGQGIRPNCVETAMQDLFNILLYNAQTQSFDVSLLPSTLKINDAFRRFYEDCKSVNVINTKEVGQAFMNLVSGIPGIIYRSGNYELPGARESNFLMLANYLLGTNAQDLHELGQILSDNRRVITFTLHPVDERTGVIKISMVIKDYQTGNVLSADLGFKPGHGELSVPDREKGTQISLLNPVLLAQNYNLNQKAQALFSVHPSTTSVLSDFKYKIPASFYYILSADGDWNKVEIIKHILRYNADNEEATDYAYHLLQSLEIEAATQIFVAIVKSGIWRSSEKFKKYIMSKPLADTLRVIAKENILSVSLVEILYENITDNAYKKIFLADVLSAFAFFARDMGDMDIRRLNVYIIAHRLLIQGADVNAVATSTGITPLCAAVRIGYRDLIELLLDNGALINEVGIVRVPYDKNGTIVTNYIDHETALGAAIGNDSDDDNIALLLKRGANPNVSNKRIFDDYDSQWTSLALALFRNKVNVIDLLLRYGADPNMRFERILNENEHTYKKKYYTYPLNLTIKEAHDKKIVHLLIQYGANVNAFDELGKTPLDYAFINKSRNIGSKKYNDDIIRNHLAWEAKNIDETIQILEAAGAKTSAELVKKQTLREKIYGYYKWLIRE
jgi:ankyrin repeat protein